MSLRKTRVFIKPWLPKVFRRISTWWIQPISTLNCWSAARSSLILPWSVRVAWATVGKPRWRVPVHVTASRLTGIRSRHAIPKESNRRSGENYLTSMVLTIRSSSMARIAKPVRPVPYVLAIRANLGGCDYSPEFNTRPCKGPAN